MWVIDVLGVILPEVEHKNLFNCIVNPTSTIKLQNQYYNCFGLNLFTLICQNGRRKYETSFSSLPPGLQLSGKKKGSHWPHFQIRVAQVKTGCTGPAAILSGTGCYPDVGFNCDLTRQCQPFYSLYTLGSVLVPSGHDCCADVKVSHLVALSTGTNLWNAQASPAWDPSIHAMISQSAESSWHNVNLLVSLTV